MRARRLCGGPGGCGPPEDQQEGQGVVRKVGTQQAQAVHDVEPSLTAFDLADEQKNEAVFRQLQCPPRGAAIAPGWWREPPQIRSRVDHRVLAAPAGPA